MQHSLLSPRRLACVATAALALPLLGALSGAGNASPAPAADPSPASS